VNPVLEVIDLCVSWPQGERVLDALSFSLAPGELLGIIGPSGCGKSTLCLTLAGIVPRQLPARVDGIVRLGGRDLTDLSIGEITTDLGIVFQDPETQLFLPRVMNELAFGPENLCVPAPEIRERIQAVAGETGCLDLLEANPNQLSGGQQQIVALTAVLAMAPKVLILDEVTSQLDPLSCNRIQAIVASLRRRGVAILMVEHNLEQLCQADRVLSLKGGKMEVAAAGEGLALDEELLARIYGEQE